LHKLCWLEGFVWNLKNLFTVVITCFFSLYFTKIISVQMSFKLHFRCGNMDLFSGVITVPIGPKSHTCTVILAVFAPQPRCPRKPWKGLLIINAIQQWKKQTECNNTLTFIHLYLAATKVNREFATDNRMKFLRFLKNTWIHLMLSLFLIQSSNSTNKFPKKQFLNYTTQVL